MLQYKKVKKTYVQQNKMENVKWTEVEKGLDLDYEFRTEIRSAEKEQ